MKMKYFKMASFNCMENCFPSFAIEKNDCPWRCTPNPSTQETWAGDPLVWKENLGEKGKRNFSGFLPVVCM